MLIKTLYVHVVIHISYQGVQSKMFIMVNFSYVYQDFMRKMSRAKTFFNILKINFGLNEARNR